MNHRSILCILCILFSGCPAACPPAQVVYPATRATGVVCASCYSGDRCDPGLLPASQVDAAIELVLQASVRHGVVTEPKARAALPQVHVCLVDHPFVLCNGGCWGHGYCDARTPPGHCLAGQSQSESVKIATVDMSGKALAVWETALAEELIHSFGVGHDRQSLLNQMVLEVNAALRAREP